MNKLFPKKISIYLFTIIFIITSYYTYYQVKPFIQGPILIISEPENGSLLNKNLVTIKGFTKNISYITINDRQIFVDEEGYLNEKILLSFGYNIIRVSAKDKYEREIEKKLELIYRE